MSFSELAREEQRLVSPEGAKPPVGPAPAGFLPCAACGLQLRLRRRAAAAHGHAWTGPPRPWGTPVPGSQGRELSVPPGKGPRESLAVWGQWLPLSKSPFFRGFGREGPSKPHGGLSRGLRGHWQLLEGPPTLPGGATCWAEPRTPQRRCDRRQSAAAPQPRCPPFQQKEGFPGHQIWERTCLFLQRKSSICQSFVVET